ncbi:MAG: hypothetical protein GC180_08790 [Bacteroidetes bacterium]|nr:hypothetical protein [Bacteroidota bacterium]
MVKLYSRLFKQRNAEYLLVLLLAYIPIFHNLDRLPFRIWDETRQAFNAYEMAEQGHYLALYFEGAPDMWNVKTPLTVICQAFCIHLFGWNELAIRLPSALAALGTVILLFHWMRKYMVQPGFAFSAVALLLSFKGYVDFHAIRTGDMDSMLCFFTLGFCYSLFEWTERGKDRYLAYFFIFLLLAWFTKSIAAFLSMPALLIYLLVQGKLVSLIKTKKFWLFASILLLIPVYYLYREYSTPGYWNAVLTYELGGRFSSQLSDENPFYYYINQHLTRDIGTYLWLLIPASVFALSSRIKAKRDLAIFCLLFYVGHQVVISSSATKYGWYDVPEFPFVAMLFLLGIEAMFYDSRFRNISIDGPAKEYVFVSIILLSTVIPAYAIRAAEITDGSEIEKGSFYELSAFLERYAKHDPHGLDGLFLAYNPKDYHWYHTIYIRRIQQAGGTLENREVQELKTGDKVLVANQHLTEQLKYHFHLHRIEIEGNVAVYLLEDGEGMDF